MTNNENRFISQPELNIGGTKICGRRKVNHNLSIEQAMDIIRFLRLLWSSFGPSTEIDNGYTYNIFDNKTKIAFRAYSGASGPSYGGSLDFFERPITGKLVPQMKQVLIDFDFWLSNQELSEDWEIVDFSDEGSIRYGMKKGMRYMDKLNLSTDEESE